MESATQYAQWRDAAAELDRREGLDQWQAEESGDEYDWRLIRSRLRQIRQYREEHDRSEEHTSELQSLMRISFAVFCLQKLKQTALHTQHHNQHPTTQLPTYHKP